MESHLKSIILVNSTVWVAMAYARFAASRLSVGLPRLIAFLPVLALLAIVPSWYSTITLRGGAAFFLTWLGIFKLLALAFGRGHLHPSLPLIPFICSATLPVKLRSEGDNLKPVAHFSVTVLLSTIAIPIIVYLYRFKETLNYYQLLALYSAHIYFSLEIFLAFAAAIVNGVLGMEMEQQVNRPYHASSLRDFWGRRWNLMVSAALRPSVYEPIRDRFGVGAGIMATFLVSGIMHEVVFYYVLLKVPPGIPVTTFFLVQGAGTAAEEWWAQHKGWWRPPKALAVPLTLTFVAATGFLLFFPVLIRGGMDEMVVEEVTGVVTFMQDAGRMVVASVGLDRYARVL